MKKMLSIGAVMMLAIMVLLAGWSVGAQPIQAAGQATGNAVGKRTKPEGQQKPPARLAPVQKVSGTAGLFVLQGLTLSKYEADTMKLLATLELTDLYAPAAPAANLPAPPASDENRPLPPDRPVPPPPPGALLLTDTSLLVVIGNNYYNIDTATLTLKVQTELPDPRPQLAQRGNEQQNMPGERKGPQCEAGTAQPGDGNPPPPPPPNRLDNGAQNEVENGDPGNGVPGPGAGPGHGPGHMPPPATVLTLQGENLLIQRGNLLVTVLIADGNIISQQTVAVNQTGQQRN